MTKSYLINSSSGYIGYITIFDNGQFNDSTFSLYETFVVSGTKNPQLKSYLERMTRKPYQYGITDIDIIKDLMLMSISTYKTNGLKYFAVDINGEIQQI